MALLWSIEVLLTCCITTPCVYVTQSFHDNNIIPTYSIHSYDMQSACIRALGANEGKLEKKYMVIDLKLLVRSFNCENRACYVGNPRES
jgi:hypothetical protein